MTSYLMDIQIHNQDSEPMVFQSLLAVMYIINKAETQV